MSTAKISGTSLLVSASTIFNEMHAQRPDLLELLMQPIATDRRGEVLEDTLLYLLIPVFSFHEGYLTVFHQPQYTDSAQRFEDALRLRPKHVEALDMFDCLANDPTGKRHLLRLWLSTSEDRPLPDVFASRVGTVEIGNRGEIFDCGTTATIPWTI